MNALSVPLAKLIQGQYIIIERWSRRAPAGKHIVDRVIGLSVGAWLGKAANPWTGFAGWKAAQREGMTAFVLSGGLV